MADREIIDAEYELVRPARGRPLPWWRRLYIDWRVALFAAAFAALAVAKMAMGGWS